MPHLVTDRLERMRKAQSYVLSTHRLEDTDSQGCHLASSQHLKCFSKRMLELFEDIEGVKVIMDDLSYLGTG